jgi:hypothetical protein
MMVSRSISWMLAACSAILCGMAVAEERQSDPITQHLFEQYIARQGKIDTESVMAATHLVAERGRESGFWKNVLAELQRDNPDSEIGCVRVLGKMLAADAAARDAIRRRQEKGDVSASDPRAYLGPEVVVELIDRGAKADRLRIDHYAIALARARVPEAQDFFKSILRATRPSGLFPPSGTSRRDTPKFTTPPEQTTAPTDPYHWDSTRFHAAVGLAQLGDAEGIEWLIEHCKFTGAGTVANAWPQGAPPGGSLSACCVQALRLLSGEYQRTSQAEWVAWWKSADARLLRDRAVPFGDP